MNAAWAWARANLTAVVVGVSVVTLTALGIGFVRQQRAIGAQNVLLAQHRAEADSLRQRISADSTAKAMATAKARADSIALVASRRAVAAEAQKTDSVRRVADSVTRGAIAAANDAAATTDQLRGHIFALVKADSAKGVQFDREREKWAADTVKSNKRILSLTEEVAAGKVEAHDLRQFNANLHDQIKLLEQQRPGFVGRYVVPVATAGVGIALGWIGRGAKK